MSSSSPQPPAPQPNPLAAWALPAVVAVGGLFLLGRMLAAPRGPRRPQAVFEAARFDIGTLKTEHQADALFPVRNAGNAPLVIEGINTSCGCTNPAYPPSIAPGQTGEIKVHFTPSPEWSGPTEKALTVHTNDPDQKDVRLVLAANLQPRLTFEPGSPVIIRYKPGAPTREIVRVRPRADVTLKVVGVRSESPRVQPTAGPGVLPREARLTLSVPPRNEPGDFNTTVHVTTDDPTVPKWRLLVVGQALTGPVVSPAEVNVPLMSRASAAQSLMQILVYSRAGALRVRKVETGAPRLLADIEPAPAGSPVTIALRTVPDAPTGRFRGRLRIHTDDRAFPVVTLPFDVTLH